jgi:DNA-binding winged helix-turn-helix (wHTH) protein
MHDQRSTPRRVEILKALVEQPGELSSREALRDRLWPVNTFVDMEHGLNAAVRFVSQHALRPLKATKD